ncbi:uncharacterized protein [Drosophila bipectinata]|uniref:uncharacterized protein n=1 Tax=Drosophila bipectinata TaxID=42026 RepID=UPI0038B2775C
MGTESYDITAGVPQGSVLGNWQLRQWSSGSKILDAKEGGPRTRTVLVNSHKVLETATIQVGGMAITSQRAIKYLGVMIDARLSFREHLDYIQGKAAATTRGLARILLNTRGPKQNRRRLLVSVASAQILYAAPIWAEAMNTPSYRRGVLSGHGCFRQYLKRFGHAEDDWCPECRSSIVKDARHVVFECRRFARERHPLETTAGRSIHPGNLVEVMLENQMFWDAVASFAAALMQRLRSIEQERR